MSPPGNRPLPTGATGADPPTTSPDPLPVFGRGSGANSLSGSSRAQPFDSEQQYGHVALAPTDGRPHQILLTTRPHPEARYRPPPPGPPSCGPGGILLSVLRSRPEFPGANLGKCSLAIWGNEDCC